MMMMMMMMMMIRGRDGGTNCILRIKEQETRLTLQEHDYNDDDNSEFKGPPKEMLQRDTFFSIVTEKVLKDTHHLQSVDFRQ
jgi:hypothetical protein